MDEKQSKKSLILKILIPVLMAGAVGTLWMIKNNSESTQIIDVTDVSVADNLKDADFSLRSETAIDYAALVEYGLPVIVDYGADTCIPCKAMAPVLEKANQTFAGKAFIKFINVWDYPEAAKDVPVQTIPTQIIFNADGSPFIPSDELAEKMEFITYTHRETGEHMFTVHQGGVTEEEMWAILAEMGVTEND